MSTYSTLLWQGEAAAAQEVVYTVPAGYTTVVRDIEVYNGSSSTLATFYIVSHVPGFSDAIFAVVNALATSHGAQWQGRAVLPTAGELEVPAMPTGIYVMISGYQLSG
jgi:hypothetical protein